MFPRIYSDEMCLLPGYEGYTFRVLVNPTGSERTDWAFGNLGVPNCEKCAKLGTARGKPKPEDDLTKRYCPDCQRARDQLGRAGVVVYGTSHVEGFDFSTPDAVLATLEQDALPDELLEWLWLLPGSLWAARKADLKKKLDSLSTSPSSSTS